MNTAATEITGVFAQPDCYKNTVIVIVGGKAGQFIDGLRPADGNIAWKNSELTHPRPHRRCHHQRRDRINWSTFSRRDSRMRPNNGSYLWHHPHKTQYGLNISTPVWRRTPSLMSSASGTGSRAIQLARNGNRQRPKSFGRITGCAFHIGTDHSLGDYAYGSSGDFGPAPLHAIHVKTGQIAMARPQHWPVPASCTPTAIHPAGRRRHTGTSPNRKAAI
jgi:hypothetical protein